MAKVSALPATVSLDTVGGTVTNISNDVTGLGLSTPYGVQDVTGIDKSAFERLLLTADGSGTLTGIFNPALSHAVLATSTVSSSARTLTQAFPGPKTAAAEVLISDYTVSRAEDGSLVWTAAWSLTSGTALGWT